MPAFFIEKIQVTGHDYDNSEICVGMIFLPRNDYDSQERCKTLIETEILKNNFNRSDCVIALGGGIFGDLSAFVSNLTKRGIKFINIPTTLLAQVDSSIGGKTGVNTKYGKNLVGSFYQPNLVISDIV